MSTRTLASVVFAAALFATGAAQGALFRAYLASDGSDVNPCTLASPCRLLPAALAAVNSGGEIWMLDSANYNTGTVSITKSVSILAIPGAVGSIVSVGGGPGLSIATGGINVTLRNLVIVPQAGGSAGTHGIEMTGASSLTVEASRIANAAADGIHVVGTGLLRVSDTSLLNNASWGISLQNGARGVVSNSRIVGDGYGGLVAYSSAPTLTTLHVADSLISVSTYGVQAVTSDWDAASARVSVIRSTLQRNGTALASNRINLAGTTELTVSGSSIVDNDSLYYQAGPNSTLLTLGNNHMSGNGGGSGTMGTAALQ
jgi:hypothetical protein